MKVKIYEDNKGIIEFTKEDIEYLNSIKPKGTSILLQPILDMEVMNNEL